jgi:hypothetical protein
MQPGLDEVARFRERADPTNRPNVEAARQGGTPRA